MAIGMWCLIPNPSDLAHFDDGRVWQELTYCLRPWLEQGAMVVERSVNASEGGLRQAVTQEWCVFHFIGHAQAHAAGYSTLALLAADGRARNLTARAFAQLIANSSFCVVVLEACEEASFCFDALADALAERDLAVILVPCLDATRRRSLLARLYTGLVEGDSGDMLARDLAAATGGAARVISRHPGQSLIARCAQAQVATPTRPVVPDPGPSPLPSARRALKDETTERNFDVFVCYHSADRPAVKRIGERLKEVGISPWLDIWELPPGRDWQDLVEMQISKVRSAAVFFGASGRGPWQQREVRALLEQFVERNTPIIPVLLADAPLKPDLPLFLRSLVWVDFRADDPDPFIQLLWGITGKRPED